MHFTTPLLLTSILTLTASSLPTTDSNLEKRFVPGQCGVHITQFQKNQGPGNTHLYRLTITLKDANGIGMGGVSVAAVAGGQSIDVPSALPAVFNAAVAYVDTDPLTFTYGDQHFSSSTDQCKFGGYDNGKREGDCGINCPPA